eukprot:COSAG01_NODE_8319_length_2831_cov_3.274890_3_plen_64_part_00
MLAKVVVVSRRRGNEAGTTAAARRAARRAPHSRIVSRSPPRAARLRSDLGCLLAYSAAYRIVL